MDKNLVDAVALALVNEDIRHNTLAGPLTDLKSCNDSDGYRRKARAAIRGMGAYLAGQNG
jgi:hypothetical protein